MPTVYLRIDQATIETTKHIDRRGDDADRLADELIRAAAVEQAAASCQPGAGRGRSPAGSAKQADAERAEHAVDQVHRCGARPGSSILILSKPMTAEHDEHAGNQPDDQRARDSDETHMAR